MPPPIFDRTCASNWLGAELLTALPHEGYDLPNYASPRRR